MTVLLTTNKVDQTTLKVLQIFALIFFQKHNNGYVISLMLIMDLLYRNKMYDKCVEMAMKVVNDKILETSQPWFYEMAILSAYKMVRS